jgi:uncharacterized membrane protein YuzA (DUF378 family)
MDGAFRSDEPGDAMQTENMHNATLIFIKIMAVIAVIGALNWGLIGLFNFNLVDAIFGGGSAESTSVPSRVVYSIVGLAGLLTLFLLPARRSEHSGPRVQSHGPTG